MGHLDLTIQVLNLPPSVTREDLLTLFSYCGSVKQVQLLKNGTALVTFTLPYAFKTALLLTGADVAGKPIEVLSSLDRVISLTISEESSKQTEVLFKVFFLLFFNLIYFEVWLYMLLFESCICGF